MNWPSTPGRLKTHGAASLPKNQPSLAVCAKANAVTVKGYSSSAAGWLVIAEMAARTAVSVKSMHSSLSVSGVRTPAVGVRDNVNAFTVAATGGDKAVVFALVRTPSSRRVT